IHRDLKPSNIKIKPDGTVKVQDFGLAKTVEVTSGDPESSPTATVSPTRAGMIMGTAAYMSPEQARGKSVDKRADIWAFGVVLYEMLTGERAFKGEDVSETMAAILRDDPDWRALPADVRPNVRRVIQQCLKKDRKLRLPDISAVRFLLDDPGTTPTAGTSMAWRLERGLWLAALVIVTAAAAGMAWLLT